MQSITNFKNIKSYHATVMYLDVDIKNPGVEYSLKSSQQLDTSFMDEITVGSLVHVIENKKVNRAIIVDIDLNDDILKRRFKDVTDTFHSSSKPDMFRKQYASKKPRDKAYAELTLMDEKCIELREKHVKLSFRVPFDSKQLDKSISSDEQPSVPHAENQTIPIKEEEKSVQIEEEVEIHIEEGLEIDLAEDDIIIIVEDDEEEPEASTSAGKTLREMLIDKQDLKRKSSARRSDDDDYYSPSSSKTMQADENNMVRIGENGTLVRKSVLDDIDWKKHRAATRCLLMELFDRETLATHTLSGRPSPACNYANREIKAKLDPKIIEDILYTVSKNCKVSLSLAKQAITSKCANENKVLKKSKEKKKSKIIPKVCKKKKKEEKN